MELMSEYFMMYGGERTLLEEDDGFAVRDPLRDFHLGSNRINNFAEAITKSRRMILLLTEYVYERGQIKTLLFFLQNRPTAVC